MMKSQLGIDIGTANIKIVEVLQDGGSIRILNAVSSPLSSGSLLSEAKADQEMLAGQIKNLLLENGIKTKTAAASLTEPQTFTKIIKTPKLSEKELNQALRWEAEQYIPMPLEDVNLDFVVLDPHASEDKMQILLAAAPVSLVEKYVFLFSKAGLELKALENEGIALLRLFGSAEKNRLVINLAASSTNFYIFKKQLLVLARTIASGANVLTRALASELNLPSAAAEEYKKTYGLNDVQADGRTAKILHPFIDSLIAEASQSLAFFKEEYPNEILSQIVLTGGGALLPQLPSYLSQKMQMEVLVLNPWEGLAIEKKTSEKVHGEESLFSVATGCALREND